MAATWSQGVDLWLNTPRRPLEASGTCGMKVPVNGGINVSVLDGWWCEGFRGDNGWAIGHGEEYEDHDYQDELESLALYDLLETEIAPLFYGRGPEGLPRDWIAMMKTSMRTLIPIFNTNRMVEDYCERFYLPASLQWKMLAADEMAVARKLASWKQKVVTRWPAVDVLQVQAETVQEFKVGEHVPVSVVVRLGDLEPEDVAVEAVAGLVSAKGEIVEGTPYPLEWAKGASAQGEHVFTGYVPCATSGRHGFAVRVKPSTLGLAANPFEMRLVRWWGEPAASPMVMASA